MTKRLLVLAALVLGALAWMSTPAGALVQCTPTTQGVTVCATVLGYEPDPHSDIPRAVMAGASVTDPTDKAEVFWGDTYPCTDGLHAQGYFVGLQCYGRFGVPIHECFVVVQEPYYVNLLYYVLPVDCPNIVPAPPPTL